MTPRIRPTRRSSAPRWVALGAALALGVLGACGEDDDDAVVDPAGDEQTTEAGGDDYSPGGGTTGDGAGDDASSATVTAADFEFTTTPVAAGAEVTFSNEGGVPHTMTADDDAFDTGTVAAGESATFTAPTEPGDHEFHCEIHSSMQATLTVEG